MFSLNLPIILTLCHIANLLECMAVFYCVKWLIAFSIVASPLADRILLFGRFPILLHHTLNVCSFLWGKDRLVLIRAEMDYRINGTLEYLACLVKHFCKLFQDVTAYFQRILQQADGLVSLFHDTAYGKAYTMFLTINLLLKLPYRLVPFNGK